MPIDPNIILGLDFQAPARIGTAIGGAFNPAPSLQLAQGLSQLQNDAQYRQAQAQALRDQAQNRADLLAEKKTEFAANQRNAEEQRVWQQAAPYAFTFAKSPDRATANAVLSQMSSTPGLEQTAAQWKAQVDQIPDQVLPHLAQGIIATHYPEYRKAMAEQAFQKEPVAAPTELSKLIAERDKLPPGDPRRAPYDAAINKQTTHQPATSVNVGVSTEKKYGEALASKLSESDMTLRDIAQGAPDLADRAQRIKQTLASGKVITGAGADYRLAFGKALGVIGASDNETIVNTETLATDLASNTLDNIKKSGLGGGTGFSNADRDFLEKAKGGKITLEAGTLNRLADLAYRSAQLSAQKWETRKARIPKDALDATGLSQEPPIVIGGTSPPPSGAGGLTKAEQEELAQLRKRFGK
ncbi:MAG TPA: hypothetical protein VF077_13270 [Nitrospiraceae bacterium]